MRRIIIAGLLVALPIYAQAAKLPDLIKGPATVLDGDTLIISGKTIRLFGVDAPEMKTDKGLPSRNRLIDIVMNRPVICTPRGHNGKKLILATCTNWRGQDLGWRMLKDGYAITNGKHIAGTDLETKYSKAERHARIYSIGQWPNGSFLTWLDQWQALIAGTFALIAGSFIFLANSQLIKESRRRRIAERTHKRQQLLGSIRNDINHLAAHLGIYCLITDPISDIENLPRNLEQADTIQVPEVLTRSSDHSEFLTTEDLIHAQGLVTALRSFKGHVRNLLKAAKKGKIQTKASNYSGYRIPSPERNIRGAKETIKAASEHAQYFSKQTDLFTAE